MNENEKALEAINNRFERMEGLSKQQWEALQIRDGFIEAKMEALEQWIKKLEERIEKLES
jgi:vacuolar-type H+-ATPase subunit E/Vma4